MKFVSKSAAETKKIAGRLAKKILNAKRHTLNAKVIALVGDLGSGKTTFVQGFAKALGIKHRMVSPTFLICRSYNFPSSLRAVAKQSYRYFYHVDLYRIHDIKELDVLRFKSLLLDANNLMLIEWAEKIKKLLPKGTIWVNFKHGRKESERTITD